MTVTYAGSPELAGAMPPAGSANAKPKRDVGRAMMFGAKKRCPACGTGRLYGKYLKVEPVCASCGEELHHHRADDAPPYFTMLVIGHLIVPIVLAVEMAWHPPMGWQIAFWLPTTLIATLALLGVVKGALVALQWALRMHGFGTGDPHELEELPPGGAHDNTL